MVTGPDARRQIGSTGPTNVGLTVAVGRVRSGLKDGAGRPDETRTNGRSKGARRRRFQTTPRRGVVIAGVGGDRSLPAQLQQTALTVAWGSLVLRAQTRGAHIPIAWSSSRDTSQ